MKRFVDLIYGLGMLLLYAYVLSTAFEEIKFHQGFALVIAAYGAVTLGVREAMKE